VTQVQTIPVPETPHSEYETVLVLPRVAFRTHFGPGVLYRPVPGRDQAALNFVRSIFGCCHAEPRTDSLEADPAFKQMVVYTVLARPARRGTEYWAYRRPPRAGDARLQGRVSVGVGGHVCLADTTGHGPPFSPNALLNAASRELDEEVGPDSHHWTLGLMGVVNDEDNAVGRCHLGFVFRAVLPWGWEPENPEGVEPLGWYSAATLQRMADTGTPFESWSGHVLSALHGWNVSEGRPGFA
jgi:predicted NUDIX family phosphoesterase